MTSGFGQVYDVIVQSMDIANVYNCGYNLFTDNLFTTLNVADFLLHKGTFITGTLRCNQLKHLAKQILSATRNVGEKSYYIKDNCLAMSYKQNKSQTKSVLMVSTFLGTYDVVYRKDDGK